MNGGGGSSFKKLIPGSTSGPINIALTGNTIMDPALFQAIGEAVVRKESGYLGKPLGPVEPKSDVVIARKAEPEMMKRRMNFLRVMGIC